MFLLSVQNELTKRQIPFEKYPDGSLLALLESSHKLFSVRIAEKGEGEFIATQVEFPKAEKSISNYEGLCECVTEYSGSYIHASFDPEKRIFSIRCYLFPDIWKREMGTFLQYCELLDPLFERAGNIGNWDPSLVKLALTDPATMNQA